MGKLRDYTPALKYGHKIYPEDIAGIVGLPSVGNIIYVDPTSGSDTANPGTASNNALATVGAAYDKCTSGNHDVVIIAPSGGSGRTTETTAITWGKRFTHIIGSAAPTAQDPRAGLNFSSTGSITFSENGCLVKNITLTGTADVNVPVTLSGSYNSFLGVDFKGSLNDTTGDDATARALYINGGQENTFSVCTFGSDTFMRSAANATIEFANAASRNVFYSPRFVMASDAQTPVHIKFTGTSAIDRWVEFNDSLWYNFTANDATKLTACMNLSAQTTTGHVIMRGEKMLVGITDWEAADSGRIYMEPATATANAIGIAINPTVS